MSIYLKLYERWTDAFDHTALEIIDGENLSFGELHQEVLNVAGWLEARGLQRGDVLVVQLPKSKSLLTLILAGLAMGIPVLPLNDRYTSAEVSYYVKDVRATLSILIVEPLDWDGPVLLSTELPSTFPDSSVQLPTDIHMDDLALLLYTSGTTGRPKGAMISHGNLLASIQALHRAWQWNAADRLMHVLPLFHVHGLVVAQFGALYACASAIWMLKWDANALVEAWRAKDITICMMVPTIVQRVLSVENVPELPTLRLVTSGSAPLPVSTHKAFEAKFGLHIVERYGMTEVGIVLSNPYDGEQRAGTVGFPLGDMKFRIVDSDGKDCGFNEVGELLISGPSVISRYWEQPEATHRTIVNGWLHSGDLATLNEDGYYSIVGRSKDLIISGGFNVYPKEVERVLLEIEGVADVAVVGLFSEEWGEEVVAVVIGQVSLDTILAVSKESLAPYKRPKRLLLVSEFPRNAMGKVQKSRLRDIVQARFG